MKMIFGLMLILFIATVKSQKVGSNLADQALTNKLTALTDFIEKAGLKDTLANGGPFTVFAPTNEAFQRLPARIKEELSQNRTALREVLLQHVLSGNVVSSNLFNGQQEKSVEGTVLRISIGKGGVTVNGSRVISPDIPASNGVIHVIDKVILKDRMENITGELEKAKLDQLLTLLTQANLDETLNTEGPFTLFAPTNEAFKELPADVVVQIKSDSELLRSLLLSHVYSGNVKSNQVTNGLKVQSVGNNPLDFKVDNSGVFVNDAKVVKADIEARNGVIHVVDKIILTPELKGNLTEKNAFQLASNGDFSTLGSLLERANLKDMVAYGGPITVFAPTNTAFGKVDRHVLDALMRDNKLLRNVLLTHVVRGLVFSNDLYDNLNTAAINGQPLDFSVTPAEVRVRNSKVVKANIKASNAVIHAIDSILMLKQAPHTQFQQPNTLEEELKTMGLSVLSSLIQAAGLENTLSSAGPFTLLAPTNDAFAALSASTLQRLSVDRELLKNVLLYHVVSGQVPSPNIRNDMLTSAVNGDQLRFNVYKSGSTVSVNGAVVTSPDNIASNGVMHIVDKVLLPPAGDIADALARDPRLSTLNTAVTAAGLNDALRSRGPMTLFAPTNEAFEAIGSDAISQLLGNREALTKVLLRHLVPGGESGTFYTAGLCWTTLPTANNELLKTGLDESSVSVASDGSSAKVIEADISVSNGVIHLIDNVL